MARLDYFAPGVYVEEVDRGSRPIEGVPTNVGGFIGFSEAIRGGAEQFKPMLITSWDQYLAYFSKEGSTGFVAERFYLPFAVKGWFDNGGGRCWIVSLGTKIPKPRETLDTDRVPAPLEIGTTRRVPSLRFVLKPEHAENGRLNLRISKPEVDPPTDDDEDSEAPPPIPGEFFDVTIFRSEEEELEKYCNLTMNPSAPVVDPSSGEDAVAIGGYAVAALERSQFIDVSTIIPEDYRQRLPLSLRPAYGTYEVSAPMIVPTKELIVRHATGVRNRQTGIQGTFEIDEINMLAFPDLMRLYEEKNPDGSPVLDEDQLIYFIDLMISLCENSAPNPPNRMVVLDAPPPTGDSSRAVKKPQEVAEWLNRVNRRSMFAALYYPWVKVANPAKEGKSILVPPCGHMMGVWARTDETRGVYKAPANETPRGVLGLAYNVNFREQELLNPMGINCIRTFPNRGIKIWGARTLVEKEKTEWRYINVRRLVSYIEKSIEEGTQWVVFEPNDEDLWARVRRTVNNFLERLWREGALFGGTPEQAFYVRCDETLNTEETMMLGRLFIEVGVRPVKPAEFVIFRVSQFNGQLE